MKLNEHINILNEENKAKEIFLEVKEKIKENFIKILLIIAALNVVNTKMQEVKSSDIDAVSMKRNAIEAQRDIDNKLDNYIKTTIPKYADKYRLSSDKTQELCNSIKDQASKRYRLLEKTVTSKNLSNKEKVNAIDDYFATFEQDVNDIFAKNK